MYPFPTKTAKSRVTEVNLQKHKQHKKTCKTKANRRHLLKAQAYKQLNIGLLFHACLPAYHYFSHAKGGETASFVYSNNSVQETACKSEACKLKLQTLRVRAL